MTDLGNTDPTALPAATPADPPPAAPPPDPAFLELVDRLTPILAEVAKSAVAEALLTVEVPTIRAGTVTGADPGPLPGSSTTTAVRSVTVRFDGDTADTPTQVIGDLPGLDDRVVALFAGGAVITLGNVLAGPVPPGGVIAYTGPITAHARTGATSAVPGQPPRGWIWGAGQQDLSRSTYIGLFRLWGTLYGAGDGATTFGAPDFRGRFLAGLDNMGTAGDAGRLSAANTLGLGFGAETHTIASGNLPPHVHDFTHTHNVTGSITGAPSLTGSITGSNATQDTNHAHDMNDVYNQGGLYGVTNGVGSGNAINNVSTRATANNNADHSHTWTYTGNLGVSAGTLAFGSGTTSSQSTTTTSNGGFANTAINHIPPAILVHYIIKT